MERIGIFSGVFDPVHKGHIAFALESAKQAKLDKVYLLVESKPRRKSGIAHFAHRVAMAKLATKPHPMLEIMELPDAQFSVAKTLPRLKQQFQDSKLLLLMGSDTAEHLPEWPLINTLLKQAGLIIGLRGQNTKNQIEKVLKPLPQPVELFMLTSPEPEISSAKIRKQISSRQKSNEILTSVKTYAKKNWLYELPSKTGSSS